MVIITKDAWSDKNEDKNDESILESSQFFGFQDLASDYFQVLRTPTRPKLCKFLWYILTAGLLSLTVFMVYKLLSEYFKYKSFNKVSVKWNTTLTLPAFTICSTNSINYTSLKNDLKDEDPDLLHDFEEYLIMSELFKGESDIMEYFDPKELGSFFQWDNGSFAIRDYYGNSVYDLILTDEYIMGGKKKLVDLDNLKQYTAHTELGQCLKINDDGSMIQKIRGSRGGFSIDLIANTDTYLLTTRTRGFIIFIRDQNETVLLNRGGYVIQPGTETFLRLNKRSVKRLGKPHGTCKNVQSELAQSKFYRTVRECVQNNSLEIMIDECKCMPWYYATTLYNLNKTDILDKNVKIITIKRNNDSDNDTVDSKKREAEDEQPAEDEKPAEDEEPTEGDEYIQEKTIYDTKYQKYICTFAEENLCNFVLEAKQNELATTYTCNEPCNFNEWDVNMGVSSFPPSKKYFEKFLKDWFYEEDQVTYDYAVENLVRLHVFYDDIKYTEVEQEKAYEIQNFIAEFGGTVDLFIGFSFFTVFQLFEIAIAWCVWRTSKDKRRKSLPGYDGQDNDIVVYNSAM